MRAGSGASRTGLISLYPARPQPRWAFARLEGGTVEANGGGVGKPCRNPGGVQFPYDRAAG